MKVTSEKFGQTIVMITHNEETPSSRTGSSVLRTAASSIRKGARVMLNVPNKKCIRRLCRPQLESGKNAQHRRRARHRADDRAVYLALYDRRVHQLFFPAAELPAGGRRYARHVPKNLSEEQLLELQGDPLAKETGARLFIGMTGDEPPFNKSHVEISYMDENEAKHYFIEPVEGNLPREGTDEAATDTRVLALLGVEPKVGAKFTIPVGIDENTQGTQYVERTFTLSGWWEYDSAIVASNVLLRARQPRNCARCLPATPRARPANGIWT